MGCQGSRMNPCSEESFLKFKNNKVKKIYYKLKKILKSLGNIDILISSQQIVFSSVIPFFYIQPKGFRSLDFFFILDRQAEHKTIHKIEGPVGVLYIHCLKIRQVSDIDEALIQLLKEACRESDFPLRKTKLSDFSSTEKCYWTKHSIDYNRELRNICSDVVH